LIHKGIGQIKESGGDRRGEPHVRSRTCARTGKLVLESGASTSSCARARSSKPSTCPSRTEPATSRSSSPPTTCRHVRGCCSYPASPATSADRRGGPSLSALAQAPAAQLRQVLLGRGAPGDGHRRQWRGPDAPPDETGATCRGDAMAGWHRRRHRQGHRLRLCGCGHDRLPSPGGRGLPAGAITGHGGLPILAARGVVRGGSRAPRGTPPGIISAGSGQRTGR